MNVNFIKKWAKAAGVRALKTVAQSALASIGATALTNDADWAVVGSTAILAGICSVLTSLIGLPEIEEKQEE